jgi:arylsulfatase A-like enzyme
VISVPFVSLWPAVISWRPAIIALIAVAVIGPAEASAQPPPRPNIVIIYADDLGYGDVSSYGASTLRTPNIDRIAAGGRRFVNAYAPAATCTPSRYALLTGEYAFRRRGTRILPGDAGLVIPPSTTTLASMLRKAGYATGVVGKWHLGLGPDGGPDWNGRVAPGPNAVGFDDSFIMAATGDRVPTVYIENERVVGLDPKDPIAVSYAGPVGSWPTGRANPEQLTKQRPSHGHDQTIVNGISRIGYMTGGRAALWVDEDMADTFTGRALAFLDRQSSGERPFFLFFALHDPHVPRVPHPRFVGRSGMGPRGDAILQADWSVGQILDRLDALRLADDTLVLFTSDNGPVVDDGYHDEAVAKLGAHRPSGPLRGGKYSAFEAGTRVPFLLRWPRRMKPDVSSALVSQVDLLRSFARLAGVSLESGDAPDSLDAVDALIGGDDKGRDHVVMQAGTLALRVGRWKYISSSQGPARSADTSIELGNAPAPQLYDLVADPGETRDLAADQPGRVAEMANRLAAIQKRAVTKR